MPQPLLERLFVYSSSLPASIAPVESSPPVNTTSGRIIRKFSGGPYGKHGAQAYNGGVGQSLN